MDVQLDGAWHVREVDIGLVHYYETSPCWMLQHFTDCLVGYASAGRVARRSQEEQLYTIRIGTGEDIEDGV
jgi:hypothetical protein